jgi:hypothetical protein
VLRRWSLDVSMSAAGYCTTGGRTPRQCKCQHCALQIHISKHNLKDSQLSSHSKHKYRCVQAHHCEIGKRVAKPNGIYI